MADPGSLTKGQRVTQPGRLGSKTGTVAGTHDLDWHAGLCRAVKFDGEWFPSLTPIDQLEPLPEENDHDSAPRSC